MKILGNTYALLQAAERYRLAFKARTAAWDASTSFKGTIHDPEGQALVLAYRQARDAFLEADMELGKFLTGDEPLADE